MAPDQKRRERGLPRLSRPLLLLQPLAWIAVAGNNVEPWLAAQSNESNATELPPGVGVQRRLESYDCHASLANWKAAWSDAKKTWCCRYQNLGCDQHVHNCQDGLANWMTKWSYQKKLFCCETKQVGCEAGQQGKHDCDAGLLNWRMGWSDEKTHWCCVNHHKGCDLALHAEPQGPKPLFDCDAGLWNFRVGWAQPKKDWCCSNRHVGCERQPHVEIVESTDEAVAKCSGHEKEFQDCANPTCPFTCVSQDCEFGSWSEWDPMGGCYGLCQRERRILRKNNECGKPCAGARVMTKGGDGCAPPPGAQCHQSAGSLDCMWDAWNEWSICKDILKQQSTRWRRVATESSEGGRPCNGAFNETRACSHLKKKDCELGKFGEWTACSASCGGGSQSRMRGIATFAEEGGLPCNGILRETQVCGEVVCPDVRVCTLSTWGQWQGCSQVMFQQFRRRSVEAVPEEHGRGGKSQEIFCSFNLLQTQGCPRTANSPHLCFLTAWSNWGPCSKECEGQHDRTRTIMHGMESTCHVEADHMLTETQGCGQVCVPKPCKLTEWAPWSPCSHRCGPGVTTRERFVAEYSGACTSLLKEVKNCLVTPCIPQDCKWGNWGFWNTCSRPCGGGSMRRARVVSEAPRHGGKPCIAKETEEVAPCNNQTCGTCIDGEWGEWGEWGACSSSCTPSFQVRHRDTVKFPNHCGKPAVGLEDEYQMCEAKECTENYDCLLSSWSPWSDCSCNCFGIQDRSRRITRTAAGLGKPCLGSMKEIVPCNPGFGGAVPAQCADEKNAADCKLSDWETWTPCTTSCGGGQTLRLRRLVAANREGGRPCNASLSQAEPCNTQECLAESECKDCLWGAWGVWGGCSKCGGQRYRHRAIDQMPNFCGRTCSPGGAKEVGTCHSDCADARYCQWTGWTDVSGCSAQCGHTSRLRQRDLRLHERKPMWGAYLFAGTSNSICTGSQIESTLCAYQACGNDPYACTPVDCQWGEWANWGAPTCTQLCDRHRVMRAVSSCGGTPCSGSNVETKRCKKDCIDPQDCQFSDWHEWTSICINEQRVRLRVIEQPASNGGEPCCGPLKETEPCDQNGPVELGPVIDASVATWTAWSMCSRNCGGGTRTRTRSIQEQAQNGGAPFCGSLKQLDPCQTQSCEIGYSGLNCQLSVWGDWGDCQENTMQYQNRHVVKEAHDGGMPCEDGLRAVRQCTAVVDCIVSPWTRWGECSRTCGGGQTSRHRQVTQNPRMGGRECPIALIQTTGCQDTPCSPDDAQVTSWSNWGPCDTDCGEGQQQRKREVISEPRASGIGFYGPLFETMPCMAQEQCGDQPRDCLWGSWSVWSHCDHACGGGQQVRTRRIGKVPRNGGKLCEALDKEEVQPCSIQSCAGGTCIDGQWATWTEWEPCSSTCKGGVTWRSRHVRTEANHCGNAPTGLSLEHQGCNMGVKCSPNQDCRWDEWADWTACSAQCEGVRERMRKIENPGRGSGAFCNGPLRQVRPCHDDPGCPHAGSLAIDCQLSLWSSWGDCDRPCGMGQMVRMRELVHPGARGGRDCNAELAQVGPCSLGPCPTACTPKDCVWTQWSAWSVCDQCDGQMRRHRFVSQHAQCGGQQCEPGGAEETEMCPRLCHAQTYCGWSDWDAWSTCSTTCGNGHKGRSRELRPFAQPPSQVLASRLAQRSLDDRMSEIQEQFGIEPDVMAKFELLQDRTRSLEQRHAWHLGAAWAGGSLSLLAVAGVLRTIGRPQSDRPLSTQGFSQLPNTGLAA